MLRRGPPMGPQTILKVAVPPIPLYVNFVVDVIRRCTRNGAYFFQDREPIFERLRPPQLPQKFQGESTTAASGRVYVADDMSVAL